MSGHLPGVIELYNEIHVPCFLQLYGSLTSEIQTELYKVSRTKKKAGPFKKKGSPFSSYIFHLAICSAGHSQRENITRKEKGIRKQKIHYIGSGPLFTTIRPTLRD